MIKRLFLIAVSLIAIVAPAASAQRRGAPSHVLEFGVDGGVLFGLDNPNVTLVGLPLQDFRVGYLVSDRLEVEPRFNLNSVHGGGNSLTTYDFQLGVLLIPGGDRVGKGLYLRPFLGVAGTSVSGAGSNSSGYAGAGFGLKIPFEDRRFATRLEANFAHGFDNGGTNQIGVLAGLSFYTR